MTAESIQGLPLNTILYITLTIIGAGLLFVIFSRIIQFTMGG